MTDSTPTYTDSQIEDMRSAVAAYDAEQAAIKAAAENARLLPLRQYCASDAYSTLLSGIDAIAEAFGEDQAYAPAINCLKLGLPTLRNLCGPVPSDAPIASTDTPASDTAAPADTSDTASTEETKTEDSNDDTKK